MPPVVRECLPRQVPLSTLFLGMALAAVALALGRWAWEWGLLAAALFGTAFVRTLRQMQAEETTSMADQTWLFVQSCCMLAFVALCVLITFVCIATPVIGFLLIATAGIGMSGESALSISLAGGLLAAAYVTKVVGAEALREDF